MSSDGLAIRVDGFGKLYRIGALHERHTTLREQLVHLARAPITRVREGRRDKTKDLLWAVDDVSFDVRHGEVVGIIGRNGAGKSTLLKMLSRITAPTTGCAEIHGRVGALLEVGTGFHGELTGRENIFLNGAILGMKRTEITRKFDDIVEFAEVARFIDTPVKRYSSGMHVRLAFAVAAHLEPEIMIVDEVLAVGDAAFQKKCLGTMSAAAQSGRTVLFVSHNMGAISQLCTRAILLEQGRKVSDGSVATVLDDYSRIVAEHARHAQFAPDLAAPISILEIGLENKHGEPTTSFDLAEEIVVVIRYVVREAIEGLQITVELARNTADVVNSFDTDDLEEIPRHEPGLYEARYSLPGMFLKAGIYNGRVTSGTPLRLLQDLEGALGFEIEERSVNTHLRGYRRERAGVVVSPGHWTKTRLGDASP
jgi:homopolymeric O-antigen transport system ATP-binding protein